MCANRRNFLHYVCTGEKSFFLCLCCFRDSVLARFNKLHSSALCSFELCRFSLVAAENSFSFILLIFVHYILLFDNNFFTRKYVHRVSLNAFFLVFLFVNYKWRLSFWWHNTISYLKILINRNFSWCQHKIWNHRSFYFFASEFWKLLINRLRENAKHRWEMIMQAA